MAISLNNINLLVFLMETEYVFSEANSYLLFTWIQGFKGLIYLAENNEYPLTQ